MVDELTLTPAAARQARRQLLARRRDDRAAAQRPVIRQADRLGGDLREDLEPGSAVGGVTPYLVGQPTIWAGLQEISKEDLSKAEGSGFPIVALILLIVFGSLAAAALPLALGFVSVLVTGALIYFISLQMTMSVFVTNMASMIGIGVAIDYSLFILARYREERESGLDQREARAKALSTSGLAVTFSGLAVIISLAGLWMVDNQALRSMALGAMTVVAVSILTATTLLPALIAMLGDRVLPGGIVWPGRALLQAHRPAPSARPPPASISTPVASRFWSAGRPRVMAHPWIAVVAVSAVLLVLAIPLLSLQTGTNTLEQFDPGGRRPRRQRTRRGGERRRRRPGSDRRRLRQGAPTTADRPRSPTSPAISQPTPSVSTVAAPVYAADSVLIQASPRAGQRVRSRWTWSTACATASSRPRP